MKFLFLFFSIFNFVSSFAQEQFAQSADWKLVEIKKLYLINTDTPERGTLIEVPQHLKNIINKGDLVITDLLIFEAQVIWKNLSIRPIQTITANIIWKIHCENVFCQYEFVQSKDDDRVLKYIYHEDDFINNAYTEVTASIGSQLVFKSDQQSKTNSIIKPEIIYDLLKALIIKDEEVILEKVQLLVHKD